MKVLSFVPLLSQNISSSLKMVDSNKQQRVIYLMYCFLRMFTDTCKWSKNQKTGKMDGLWKTEAKKLPTDGLLLLLHNFSLFSDKKLSLIHTCEEISSDFYSLPPRLAGLLASLNFQSFPKLRSTCWLAGPSLSTFFEQVHFELTASLKQQQGSRYLRHLWSISKAPGNRREMREEVGSEVFLFRTVELECLSHFHEKCVLQWRRAE